MLELEGENPQDGTPTGGEGLVIEGEDPAPGDEGPGLGDLDLDLGLGLDLDLDLEGEGLETLEEETPGNRGNDE